MQYILFNVDKTASLKMLKMSIKTEPSWVSYSLFTKSVTTSNQIFFMFYYWQKYDKQIHNLPDITPKAWVCITSHLDLSVKVFFGDKNKG